MQLQPRGRRAPQARAADRRGVQAALRGDRDGPEAVIEIEVDNRSGVDVDETGRVRARAPRARRRRASTSGELGLVFVGPDESRALKQEHLGIDEATDALAFPIDALDDLPDGLPRQLGDVVDLPAGRRRRVAGAARARRAASRRLRPRRRDGSARGAPPMSIMTPPRADTPPASPPAPGRAPSLLDSFNYAFEGIIHVLRTQRNLRIHFAIAIAVIAAAAALGVERHRADRAAARDRVRARRGDGELRDRGRDRRLDDVVRPEREAREGHRRGRGAHLHDHGALRSAISSSRTPPRTGRARFLDRVRDAPAEITLVALVLVILIVIATKAWTGRGTPLRGGLPSGHAALAFAGWMAATYVISDDHRFLISSLTFIMALLVAQTRVESGVHSALEVLYGGALGALVTLVVFQVLS